MNHFKMYHNNECSVLCVFVCVFVCAQVFEVLQSSIAVFFLGICMSYISIAVLSMSL